MHHYEACKPYTVNVFFSQYEKLLCTVFLVLRFLTYSTMYSIAMYL